MFDGVAEEACEIYNLVSWENPFLGYLLLAIVKVVVYFHFYSGNMEAKLSLDNSFVFELECQ